MNDRRPRIDVAALKAHCRGNWLSILPGIDGRLTDAAARPGQHGPCPVHGGRDGFRLYDDAAETGGGVSNRDGQFADGIALTVWLTGCTFTEALQRIADASGYDPPRAPAGKPNHSPEPDAVAAFRAKCHRRFDGAEAGAERIARYLHHRGLSGDVPPGLRLIADESYHDGKRQVGRFPVMAALVTGPDGRPVQLHRTYLATDGDGKAPVSKVKKLSKAPCRGIANGGAVRLYPATGDGRLDIAEGIETAIAVRDATGRPCWTACNAVMLRQFVPPPGITELVIWSDHDANDTGQRAAAALADRLTADGLTVRVVLPERPGDWLDMLNDDGRDALIEADAAAEPFVPVVNAERERPDLEVGQDEQAVADEAFAALAERGDIYRRGGQAVQIGRDDSGSPLARVLDKHRLRALLTTVRQCVKADRNGDRQPCRVPVWLTDHLGSTGGHDALPPLNAITETPFITADGTVVTEPGYHPPSGTWLAWSVDPIDIPEQPTTEDAKAAAAELLDIVCDFPFKTPSDRAAWLAALLTAVARPNIAGPTPLFLVNANQAGAGKSKLCELVSLLATGRGASMFGAEGGDTEMSKKLTAIAIAAPSLVVLDNISGPFGYPSLDRFLTTGRFSGRRLGTSEVVTPLVRLTMMGSGNNAVFRGDIGRRTVTIRVLTTDDRPEQRSGFKHADVEGYVAANRHRLVRAALVLLRAFHVAGRPAHGAEPLGSFGRWDDAVRSAVVWSIGVDPLAHYRESRDDADDGKHALAILHSAIDQTFSDGEAWFSSDIQDAMRFDSEPGRLMTEAVGMILPDRVHCPTTKDVGNALTRWVDVPLNGRAVQREGRSGGRTRYILKAMEPVGAPLHHPLHLPSEPANIGANTPKGAVVHHPSDSDLGSLPPTPPNTEGDKGVTQKQRTMNQPVHLHHCTTPDVPNSPPPDRGDGGNEVSEPDVTGATDPPADTTTATVYGRPPPDTDHLLSVWSADGKRCGLACRESLPEWATVYCPADDPDGKPRPIPAAWCNARA